MKKKGRTRADIPRLTDHLVQDDIQEEEEKPVQVQRPKKQKQELDKDMFEENI